MILKRRRLQDRSGNASMCSFSAELKFALKKICEERHNIFRIIGRTIHIASTSFNFNAFGDADSVKLFRFESKHVGEISSLLGWPLNRTHTTRNRYATCPMLSTCVVLRRLQTPARWYDMERLFGKHASHLSEIFLEALEEFIDKRSECILSLSSAQVSMRASRYADAVRKKGGANALSNCVGFIDGTVIGISRPGDNFEQRAAYNGHKRKHALKFQALVAPDGLILHAAGPLEGRRHDWTLYLRSGLDAELENRLHIEGTQYCIYGDSG
jgi:nuclease HARBI1